MSSQTPFLVAFQDGFGVETVEFDICDTAVENFAERGKKQLNFYSGSCCSQPVGNILHNSEFLSNIRIFWRFANGLSANFPQEFWGGSVS